MIYVIASVLCSVLVSVLLKLARRWSIDIGQAIAWNYLVALGMTACILRPELAPLHQAALPWFALLMLGLLLPTIFLTLAASVRHAGIVRSDAAQRLSLAVPLLAAFALFGETLTWLKAFGIVLGLLALLGMIWRANPAAKSSAAPAWRYPLLVFAGFGVIDVLFKRVAATGVPLGSLLLAMFTLALLVVLALQLARRWRSQMRFKARSVLGGVLLGLFNFGNIFFYLRGHQALPAHPALVFASMNLGVVMLGGTIGAGIFGERLSRLNVAGILLALVAIALIAFG